MKRSSWRGEAGEWRGRQRLICVEAMVEVDRGGGKGRFMGRPVCEGSDRGRSRQIEVAEATTNRGSGRSRLQRQW